jgi:hypothetical protein
MTKGEYSSYQGKVISRYYDNIDNIMLTKLSELVSELYLAKTDARRKQLWQRVNKAMENLKVKPGIIRHIMEKQDIEILAKNLQDWLAESRKK